MMIFMLAICCTFAGAKVDFPPAPVPDAELQIPRTQVTVLFFVFTFFYSLGQGPGKDRFARYQYAFSDE